MPDPTDKLLGAVQATAGDPFVGLCTISQTERLMVETAIALRQADDLCHFIEGLFALRLKTLSLSRQNWADANRFSTLADTAKARLTMPTAPLTSVGPSGIGGYAQTERTA